MKFEEAREIAQNMRNRGRALEKEGDILSEIAIALVILDDRVNELETERLHLRALIRGEQIKPPFDIEDDVTTELAVALADMEKQRDELIAVCKRAAARQPEALGKMEKHNIVLDDLNNIYQKTAFTFYSMLVQTTQEIEAVFEEQEIKHRHRRLQWIRD